MQGHRCAQQHVHCLMSMCRAEPTAGVGQHSCVKDAEHAFSRCTPAESGQAAVLHTVELRVDFSPTPAASQASARRTKKKSAMSTCTKAHVGNTQHVQMQAIQLYVLQDICQAPAAKPVGSPKCLTQTLYLVNSLFQAAYEAIVRLNVCLQHVVSVSKHVGKQLVATWKFGACPAGAVAVHPKSPLATACLSP